MALPKDIYRQAKDYVKDPAQLNNHDLFESTGTSKNYDNKQSLFTLVCLRLLMQDKTSFTDPIQQEEAFRTIARTVRLNEFSEFKKDIDLGFGKGNSNNLIYKLATQYYAAAAKEVKTKPLLIKKALQDPKFIETVASNSMLDDDHTYACLTKQAFYKWHYENYINNTALRNVIKKENAADGSVKSWSDIVTSPNADPTIFISRSGAPFNAGFPVICVVFEGVKDDLLMENKGKLTTKAFDYLFPLVGRKKYSDFSAGAKEDLIDEFVLVKEFTHKRDVHAQLRIKILETGDKIKVCIGADYAQLMWGLGGNLRPETPKQLYFDSIQYALASLGEIDSRYALNKKSLLATNDKNTDAVFNDQLSSLIKSLDKKDASVQSGPALFFNLENKAWYNDLISDLEKYEKIDDVETVDAILKPQYSLSLKNIGATIKESYEPLIEQYKIQRNVDPRIFHGSAREFDPIKILENIVFYYDQSYNLLAIGAVPNKSTKEGPSETEIKLQRNNIPFEFSEIITATKDGKTQQIVPPLSILDKYYSVLPLPPDDSAGSIAAIGLDGPVLMVTEYFVDAFDKYYNKLEVKSKGGSKKLSSLLDKKEVFTEEQLDEKVALKANIPFTVSFRELESKAVGANEVFATLVLKTANRFFQASNEIILGDTKGGTYSFLTKSLEVAGGVADFFSEPKTFEDAELVTADNIQVFLDRFHYPSLLIKPTVPKQKSAEAVEEEAHTIEKNEGTPSTKKDANEKVIDLDDYNSSYKLFSKEVFVIAAQSSNSPCLTELAGLVKSGTITDVYTFLLTKFPWDQIIAKSMLTNLRRISNLIDTESSKDFADQVNACLKDLNVEKILAAFANFKNSFKNLDDIINASLPEIPKLGVALPYIYILDFQKIFRELLFKAITEAVLSALQLLLGVMLKELLSACEQDGSLQTMLFDSNEGSLSKDGRHAKESMEDSVNRAAFSPITDDEYGSKKVYVDLITLLRASRVDNLENILNGLLDLFPLLKVSTNPLVNLENFLDDLSAKISAYDTKNLLAGIAGIPTTNKVINFATTQPPLTKIPNVFNNKYNVLLLYKHLNKFIDLDLINKKIVETTVIVPDPCFINLGSIGTEDLQLLRDFLGDDADAYVDGLVNDAANQLSSLCARFADGVYKSSIELPNLISQSSKKALQGAVDSSIEPVVDFQNSTKALAVARSKKIAKALEQIFLPEKKPTGDEDEQVTQIYLPTTAHIGSRWKDPETLRKIRTIVEKNIDESKIKEGDLEFYKSALGSKTGAAPDSFFTESQLLPGGDAEYVGRKDFFIFLYGSLFGEMPHIKTELEKFLARIKKKTAFNELFEDPKVLREEVNKKFDEVINEGGKNTNFYVANLKEMKRIIKSLKQEK